MNDLAANFSLNASALGHLTSSVQFGFILGTLCFAIFTIADRYSPSRVFFVSAVLGALFNLGITWEGNSLTSILFFRFATGFFLAGIYPVGMKIAADYFDKGLGKSLGYLVGALVVGTAFPHLLKDMTGLFPWRLVIMIVSGLALTGGLLMQILVPDGPFRKTSASFDSSAFMNVFRDRKFRAAAFGYFGHMWELYAFWTFIPLMLGTYVSKHSLYDLNISQLSFTIIAIGGFACVLGGYFSQAIGVKRTATTALLLSCLCCLISPLLFATDSQYLFIGFLLFWGMVVIADSPLFSTLVAQRAPADIKGTALTIVNSIGFAVTIISIQLISILRSQFDSSSIYMILAIGPLLGLWALSRSSDEKSGT